MNKPAPAINWIDCPSCEDVDWDIGIDTDDDGRPYLAPGLGHADDCTCSSHGMSSHEDPRCPTDSSCELCSGTGSVDADTICVCCKKRLKTEEAEAHRYGHREDPVPSDQFGDYCDHCIETLVVNGLIEDMIADAHV